MPALFVILMLSLSFFFVSGIIVNVEKSSKTSDCKEKANRSEIALINKQCYVKVDDNTYLDVEAFLERRDNKILKNASKSE